ncbi:uncharacterized protein [Pseudorasbora parva]|uniref:uncharacterized protein n=1 Tax=Pseudorasbora parva TaxID=51549 RepID=UPI00351E34F4
MRIKHSGLYKLQIYYDTGTTIMKFSVTVSESKDAFIDVGEAEVKSVSVMEGDPVTLQTDVTETHGNELIVWRFGDEGKLIAKCDIETNSSTLYETDERFRDRLKLDHQTGSLTITHTRTEDSGLYRVEIISSSKQTIFKRFSVTVMGAVAGIVVVLLVSSASAAGVYYYRHRICDLKHLMAVDETDEDPEDKESKTYETKSLLGKEGESVTLKTDAEIQENDQILWMFGPQENIIAQIIRETKEMTTFDGPDGRFKDRLKLESSTGSLTITNISAEHIGVYKLQTITSRGTSNQRFIVTVKIIMISLDEGVLVTLYPDTEINKDDLILWTFGDEDTLIAQMTGKTRETYEGTDGRFLDRLKVDKKTGSLTISGTRTEHSGLYKLQISSSSSRGTTNKRFKVAINLKKVSTNEGESVTLRTNAVIQRKDQLLWLFGDDNSLIAEIKGGIAKIITFGIADGRFRDRLQLDEKTGSLDIRNLTAEHAGVYTLKIISSNLTKIKRCNVAVRVLKMLGMKGKDVTLNPITEVKRDDLILWMFGDKDSLIAQLTGETGETTYTDDERFIDKLKLDKNTGSLTISNITAGPYKLQISSSSRRTVYKKIRVFMCCESGPKTVSVSLEECLILFTDFNIERDEKVEWRFKGKTLATGMSADISKTSYGDDERFRGRLELHYQTGSLTIKNTRSSDTGVYQLKISSGCGKNICWEFSVTVRANIK